MTDETDQIDNGDGDTESTATRHKYTNDAGFFILVLGWFGLIAAGGLGVIDLAAIQWYLLLTTTGLVGTAVVWAFGPEAMKAWHEAKPDPQGGDDG